MGGLSMQNVLNGQFNSFKQLISNNLSTIRGLLTQVKDLSKLVESERDENTKKNLSDIQSEMEDKISELIDNTEQLFELYKKNL